MVQSDILEKELGEIQKVLLAMQVIIIPSIGYLYSEQPILCSDYMNFICRGMGCAMCHTFFVVEVQVLLRWNNAFVLKMQNIFYLLLFP